MTTRQYIGARYVPILDGDWDITKDYEPLVIVSYQGNSYTSRTFVPHGTAITNETYWALTGNYNAQVEAYRQEVQDYTAEVAEAISDAKESQFIGNEKFDMSIAHMEYGTWDILSGDDYKSTYVSIQGGDYNPNIDKFVIGICDNSANMAILVTIDTDFTVVSRHAPQALGHCNDIAYNPRINKYFVATGDSSINAFNIVCLDGDTLDIDYSHTGQIYGTNVPKYYISYDNKNDVYYIGDANKIHVYKFDLSTNVWTLQREFEYSTPLNSDGLVSISAIRQSSFCYDGTFVMSAFTENNDAISHGTYNNYYLLTFDENGNIVSSARYDLTYPTEEPECICVKNGIGYVFVESNWYIVRELFLNRAAINPILDNKSNYVAQRVLAPAESGIVDLNNIVIPGKYSVNNSASANNITHMPVASSGNLYVENIEGSGKLQTYIPTGSKFAYRRTLPSGGSWSSWISMEERCDMLGRSLISGTIDVGDTFNRNPNNYFCFACFLNNSYGQSGMFGIKSGSTIRFTGINGSSEGNVTSIVIVTYGLKEGSTTEYEVKSINTNDAASNFTSISYISGII